MSCPECNARVEFEHWESVTTTLDPEMLRVVLEGRINLATCGKCELSIYVDTPFLLSSPENHYMIWFMTEGMPSELDDDVPEFFKSAPKYQEYRQKTRMRVVRNRRDLAEKALIFESGLDDRVIEYVKATLRFSRQPGRKHSDSLVFAGRLPDGKIWFDDLEGEELAIMPPGAPTLTFPNC